MKVLQVVGFKNSGKTTLISRWIGLVKSQGKKVVVIKHHGHPEPLERPAAYTDGVQYIDNGADGSIVAGGGGAQILLNNEPNLTQLMDYATINPPDILLIEGFKNAEHPKVVLLREEKDWDGLQKLRGIEKVFPRREKEGFPYLTDEEMDQWFLQWIGELVE